MSILERLSALFAPDDCLSCGREGRLLCPDCEPALPEVLGNCYGCHQKINGVACKDCLREAGLSCLTSASNYKGISKDLVSCLKFSDNQSAAAVMARCMLPCVGEGINLLSYMPATNAHIRERGYDQSRLVVRHIARLTGLPYAGVLRRRGNHHQLGAGREQRLKQLSSIISVANPGYVAGKTILVIDDVLTTGSSLHAASSVLLEAGAREVRGLTFAQSIASN